MTSPAALPMALVAILAGIGLPGCIDTGDGPGETTDPASIVAGQWWLGAIPSSLTDDHHDHADRSMHAGLTTPNFEELGWDPLVTQQHDETLVGMGCGGAMTREDGLRLAVVHSIATDVSFVVADITDPAAPRMVGEFYMPNAVVWDADITADGMHVLVGAYPWALRGPVPTLPIPPAAGDVWRPEILFRDACTGQTQEVGPVNYLPFGPGIVMVGIQDPAAPTFEDWVPQPVVGPHSVSSALVDGVVYATSSVTNLVHRASYYTFFEVTDTPAGGRLVPLSVVAVPGPVAYLNGHIDVAIAKHPMTEQVLAYLANADGVYVYDITQPRAPMEIGMWADGDAGAVHTTYQFPDVRGDKQYLLAAQEVGEPVDLPSGWTYILDVTDPTAPTEVGRWTLPVKPKWDDGALQFSPHYVAVLGDTMFVSNYHGGLWAVDIGDLAKPEAVGIFVPARESPAPWGGEPQGPSIEDVIVDQTTGIITTWDQGGGVYQLRFRDEMPAERAPAWSGDGV